MHRALLVCNSSYPDFPSGMRNLFGPQIDGLYLWRQLTDETTGIFEPQDVVVLFERSKREAFVAIEQFFQSARSGDVLFFYFSGHGYAAGGSLYLCVRDTDPTRIRATGISTDEIDKIIKDSHAESIVIVLDCCYSGGFKGIPAAKLTGTGRYVITATTSVEQAQDATEPGSPSPFTEALIESLRDGAEDSDHDGFVDVDDVFRDVEVRVPDELPTPERDFDGAGRVRIAARPTAASASPSRAQEARAHENSSSPFMSLIRGLPASTRQRGDFTLADRRGFATSLALGIALMITGALAFRYMVVEFTEVHLPERWATAAAAWLGAIQVLLAVAERLAVGRRLPAQLSRRRFLLLQDGKWARRVRRLQLLVTVPALALIAGPLTGRGYVTASWVACGAILALLVLVTGVRWLRVGDATFAGAAILLVIGNCIPIEFSPAGESTAFHSGLESTSGLAMAVVGSLMVCGWWWRIPTPWLAIVVAVGLLTLLASAGDAIAGNNPHWFLSGTALIFSALSLFLGAGRLLPMNAAETSRAQ